MIEVWSTTIFEKGDKSSAIEGCLTVPVAASGVTLNMYSGFFLEEISLDIWARVCSSRFEVDWPPRASLFNASKSAVLTQLARLGAGEIDSTLGVGMMSELKGVIAVNGE